MKALFGKIVAFTQNTKYLSGFDNKNRLKIWNTVSFENPKSIDVTNKSIKCIALHDNDLLAIGYFNDSTKIEIWNITIQSKIATLNDHNDNVNALLSVELLEKRFLISGSTDTTIRMYDSHFRNIQTLNGHEGAILTLDYNYHLKIIASSSTDTVKIWYLSNKLLVEKTVHILVIQAICVLENGLIATGSYDSTIKIWKKISESSLEVVTTLTEHESAVYALISLKNSSLVSGSYDGKTKIWNQINETYFECVATLKYISGVITLALWENTLLMSGHANGEILLRNQTSFELLQTLKGHTNRVRSIISLNNEYLVTASNNMLFNNNRIIIWYKINKTSFKLFKKLSNQSRDITSLAALPNNMFASSSQDYSIAIWNTTSFECITVLRDHTDSVESLIVYQNRHLISISHDKMILIWDIYNSFKRITTTQTSAKLYSLTLSSNLLITGNENGSIQIWDINSIEICFIKKLDQTSNEYSTKIFYRENYLLTGRSDGTFKIFMWKMNSYEMMKTTKAHNSNITSLTNINDRNLFASGSAQGEIKIWDSNFVCIQTLNDQTGSIIGLIYWQISNSLISSSGDLKLNIYKSREIQLSKTIYAHNKSVQNIAILDKNLIATCSGDKTIKIWNGSTLITTIIGHIDFVYSLEYFKQEKLLISGSRDTLIKVWDASNFNLKANLIGHNSSVISLALIENQTTLISGSCDHSIIIWNLTSFSLTKSLRQHTGCVNALNIQYKFNFLISGSSDKTILIWDIGINFELINQLFGHENAITSLKSFQSLLVSASQDNTIKIWYFSFSIALLNTNKRVHTNRIKKICVLENGLIATGSYDSTIKIWKKISESSLEVVTTLTEHESAVYALISLKNSSLVSGSYDGKTKIWNQINETYFECVATLKYISGVITLALWENTLLMSGHANGEILLRNQTSFELLQTLKGHTNQIQSMITLNEERLATASYDMKIIIWQKMNETSFEMKQALMDHKSYVNSLVVLPNNMFASASSDSSIIIWEQTTFESVAVLNGHTASVLSLIVNKNKNLISTSQDASIAVWDIDSFKQISVAKTSTYLYSLTLFSNYSVIAGGDDGSIQIWSTSYFTFKNEKTLTLHDGPVSDLEIMKNGFVVSSSLNSTIKIWGNSLELVSSTLVHESGAFLSIKIGNRGDLISSTQDGKINFWNTNNFIFNRTIYIS